jgi:bifunctional non-homologous end joining protein LigD
VSSPNVIESKLDRLLDDMRFLRSQMIAFDKRLKGIEACLKPGEPSEQQPEANRDRGLRRLLSRPQGHFRFWFQSG